MFLILTNYIQNTKLLVIHTKHYGQLGTTQMVYMLAAYVGL
jgi:hypothetical protein